MKLVTVSEMQAIEREANAAGLSYAQMMEHAGRGLAELVAGVYGDLKQEGVLGLVGPGNNGGDTLVALAHLAQQGWMASAYLARPRPADDPLLARLQGAGGKIYRADEDAAFEQLAALVGNHAIQLDGVLGTGVRLPLKAEISGVLRVVRLTLDRLANRPHVVAVDVPSGVDSDSGAAAPDCIPAELTVTMAAIKQGLLKFPAFNLIGKLQVVGIGLPETGAGLETWQAVQRMVPDAAWVRAQLPERPPDAHKGTFGTAMVVAGSLNYTGAALLAGQAAYRSGAGLVTLAIPAQLHAPLAGQLPEATWVLLPDDLGVISAGADERLRKNLDRATALLVGPGLGVEDTTAEFIKRLFSGTSQAGRSSMGFTQPAGGSAKPPPIVLPPAVIDADGLKLLARLPDWSSRVSSPAVLTPHPGEMSVLTGLDKTEIQAGRLEIAERFSRAWGHVVVLKGAFTVVAAPEGRAAVIPVASPALARAGTGDVLAGLIVGLRAQGLDAFPAAVAGAWIHAQAGLHAAQVIGNTASVLAGDVLNAAVDVLSELQLT